MLAVLQGPGAAGGAGTREAATPWEAETATAGPFCPLFPLHDLPHVFFLLENLPEDFSFSVYP